MSYHAKEKQLEIIRDVYDAGLELLSPSTTDELYPQIAKTLESLIRTAYISIYSVYGDELVKVYTTSNELEHVFPRKGGFTYKSFQESIPFLINKKNVNTIHPELKQIGVKSTLVIPLLFQEEPIGVLSLDFHKERSFSPHVIDALQLFSSIATFKIKNIELEAQLRELIENQKTFISLASHELKNPLTTVFGYASIISRQVKKGIPIDPKITDTLISEIQRMSQLIDELLNAKNSDLEKGALKYKKRVFSFKKLVEQTITTWKVTYPNRKVLLESEAKKDIVFVDTQKIKQVIINLLNNAAKFSPEHSTISVNLKNSNDYIHCTVKDEGIGIAQNEIDKIFKRFYKGKKGKPHEGMGLGLYLCKQIIKDHSGKIEAQSTKGKGALLEIKLPLYVF